MVTKISPKTINPFITMNRSSRIYRNKSFLIKRKKRVRKMKKKGKPKSFASIYRFIRASNSENKTFYNEEVEISTTPLERTTKKTPKTSPFWKILEEIGRNWRWRKIPTSRTPRSTIMNPLFLPFSAAARFWEEEAVFLSPLCLKR